MRPRQRLESNTKPNKVGSFSYYSNRNSRDTSQKPISNNVGAQKTSSSRQKTTANNTDSQYWIHRLGFVFLMAALIASMFTILKLDSNPNIIFLGDKKKYQYSDAVQQNLYNSAAKDLRSSIFNINKLTVNSSGIRKNLMNQYPEFANITINIPILDHRPIIYLDPSYPVFILKNINGQYLINQNGAAFMHGDNTAFDYLKLINIEDQSGYQIKLGSLAMAKSDVDFINEVAYQLKAKGLMISKVVLPQSSREADIYLKGKTYFVKFNIQSDTAREQVGTFLASDHYTATHNINVSQYYDVRVDGRAYYK